MVPKCSLFRGFNYNRTREKHPEAFTCYRVKKTFREFLYSTYVLLVGTQM